MFNPPMASIARMNYPGGVDLGTAIVLPPGGEIRAYVRSTGPADGDPLDLNARLVPTLNEGLKRCRSGRGDVVLVLPGHTESISAADQMADLVAGTRIIGCGYGSMRPTFTWTAATATFLFNVANVSLENCRLFLAGPHAAGSALTVAAPITVSAADCRITECEIWAGFDADQIVTIGITTTAAADRFKFTANTVRGAAAAVGTTFLRIVGGDSIEIAYNDIVYGTSSAAIGVVQALTTAPTNIRIHDNYLEGVASGQTAALTLVANATGTAVRNDLKIAGTGTAYVTTPGSVAFYETRGVNAIADGTAEKPTADFGTASA